MKSERLEQLFSNGSKQDPQIAEPSQALDEVEPTVDKPVDLTEIILAEAREIEEPLPELEEIAPQKIQNAENDENAEVNKSSMISLPARPETPSKVFLLKSHESE